MKRNLTLYFIGMLFACIFSTSARSAAPTLAATNLSFSSIEGNSISLGWTSGNGARRIIIARQGAPVTALPVNGIDYIASGTFGLGNELSDGQFVVYSGSGNIATFSGLNPGTTYYLSIFEYNGSGFSSEYLTTSVLSGSKTTVNVPTTAASGVTFSNVTGNSMKVSWTSGNGAGRIVLMRAGAPINVNPDNLVAYTASSAFGIGDQIGSGTYVIFRSSTSSVTVTGLQPNTSYYVAVFEYNGNNGPMYLASGPATGSQATAPRPSVPASGMNFTNVEGNGMTISWSQGNGSRRVVVARAGSPVSATPVDGATYSPNAIFGSGQEIAPGEFVLYDGTSSSANIKNLVHSTNYYFAVYEYDGSGSTSAYLTSTFLAASKSTQSLPALPTSNLLINSVSSNSISLNWTNGDGASRIVVAKAGGPVDALPVNYTQYSGSAAFGNGTQIGTGNYVVYKGSATTTTVINLASNVTYHFAVYELNGSTAPVYITTTLAINSATTNSTPTIASSNLVQGTAEGNAVTFNWTAGNGTRRMAIVRKGAPVTATPVNGQSYTASSVFGNGTEISTGEFVSYDGTGSSFSLSNLQPGNSYYVAIFEYNGSGATSAYLTTTFLAGNNNTLVAPSTPATNLVISAVTGNSVQLNWTNGNGSRRLVLATQGATLDVTPTDLVNYSPSASFGSGTAVAPGVYSVYNTNGSSVKVINLQPNTTYSFAVYECNGQNGPVYTSIATKATQLTAAQPAVPSSGISFSSVEGNSMNVAWTPGNGSKRLVVAKAGSPITGIPQNGISYSASNFFGSGSTIATSEYVIMNGTNSNVVAQGLVPGITYYFAVFEYDGSGANTVYLTSSFASAAQATVSAPAVPASNLFFTNITNTSMTLNWSHGDGAQRIVIARKDSPVNVTPANLSAYQQSAAFGSGSNLGNGNYVVFRGNVNAVTITNLQPGTTYYYSVFEYNGATAPIYLMDNPALGDRTTIGAPQRQATDMQIAAPSSTSIQVSWTNGSGQKRIVLARKGSPVDVVPQDDAGYNANSFFGSGDQLGSGNYVVYNGTANVVNITNLEPVSLYYFAVFEFNDFGASKMYLVTDPARGNSVTAALPVLFTNVSVAREQNSITVKWSTATEINAAYFEVQRSSDGQHFSPIGRVAAAGNSNSARNYLFQDVSATTASWYYRIMEADLDGRTQYSKIVRSGVQQQTQTKLLSNPVHDQLQLALGTNEQPVAMRVHSLSGQQLYEKTGIRDNIVAINCQQYPAGMYIVEVYRGAEKETLQFIKQ